jgi:hypothetical protein
VSGSTSQTEDRVQTSNRHTSPSPAAARPVWSLSQDISQQRIVLVLVDVVYPDVPVPRPNSQSQ